MNDITTPPHALKQPIHIEQLGRVRTDDYAWMKDPDWQLVLRDPARLRADIRAHLLAENAYTDAVLAGTTGLQETIRAEMKSRIQPDDAAVPRPDGAFAYGYRYEAGAEHPRYIRTPRDGGPETLLLDADAQAAGHAYYRVIAAHHSPDHRQFAYAEDTQGSEIYRVRVIDIATRTLLPDPIESCMGEFVWSPCSRYIFWVFVNDSGRPDKVYRRTVGRAEDVLIYEETDQGFFVGLSAATSGGSIFITTGDNDTSEVYRIPGNDPTAPAQLIEPRTKGLRYRADDWRDRLIILTNADDATDFKLVEAPFATPGRAHWRDLVPHRPGHFIAEFTLLADYIIRVERADANNRIIIRTRDGGESDIAVHEQAYVLALDPGLEFDTATLRFIYSSPTTPRQWFDYDIPTGARQLRKTQTIPAGHDPAQYETRRLTATAADGATIPITILMRRGTPLDGSAPLHLYGYGSYGMSIQPWFQSNILSLVDRGWIHAIAHIRGGTEKGWNWFLAGRGPLKMNSFTDFIAVAEHLIAENYTRPRRIVAHGGSAGGLLMGAVLNIRPDLWAGVIAAVPFVDVLNTISDETLPLTPLEWPEWGNPLTDAAAYDTIAAYSPYDNITAQPYPPVLATGGLSDPRVTYWEPAKFVARLRDHTTGTAPIMARINMDAGHFGNAGRFDALKQLAQNYAFAIWAIER